MIIMYMNCMRDRAISRLNSSLRRVTVLLGLLFVLSLHSLEAQIVSSRQPLGWESGGGLRTVSELPTLRMPHFDTDSARMAMEAEDLKSNRTFVFAHKLYANVDIIREGRKVDMADRTAWFYRVRSKGAESLNFLFEDFHLPEGGLLFVYTPDMKRMLGGWGAVNNNAANTLPTGIINSDEVIIECQAPKGATTPRLRLTEVNHGVRHIHIAGEPRFGSGPLKTTSCAPNVACLPELTRLSQSVVVLAVNGTLMGTAALINNTRNDGTPYLISAYHVFTRECVSFASMEHLAKTVVAFFNYASPTCSGEVRGTEEQSVAGATLVGVEPTSDAIMIKLNSAPPRDYSPYYCGWNAGEAPQGQFTNIHHPRVLPKRIGVCNRAIRIGTTDGGSPRCPFEKQRHWVIPGWDIGTTQPGSSGSPLFDKDHLFIGALTGGSSECHAPQNEDYFYAFSKLSRLGTPGSTAIMKALDPGGGSAQKCEPFDPFSSGGRLFRVSHISGLHKGDSLHHLLSNIERDNLLNTSNDINAIGERFVLSQGTEMAGFYTVLRQKGAEVSDQLIKYAVYTKNAPVPVLEGEISLKKLVTYTTLDKEHSDKKRSPAPYMEVYTPFPMPIKSDAHKEYIIALDIKSIASSLTPLAQEKSRERNTLYYRRGDTWEPASRMSAPFAGGAALWIDPLLTSKETSSLEDEETIELFTIKNSYANAIEISINRENTGTNQTPSTLEVFDLGGRRLYEKTFTTLLLALPREAFEGLGVLIFRVRRGGEEESVKAYFPAV